MSQKRPQILPCFSRPCSRVISVPGIVLPSQCRHGLSGLLSGSPRTPNAWADVDYAAGIVGLLPTIAGEDGAGARARCGPSPQARARLSCRCYRLLCNVLPPLKMRWC